LAEDRVDFVSWGWGRLVEQSGRVGDGSGGEPRFPDGPLSALPQMERSPNISWLFHCRIVCEWVSWRAGEVAGGRRGTVEKWNMKSLAWARTPEHRPPLGPQLYRKYNLGS
jgi:hypothetical protein